MPLQWCHWLIKLTYLSNGDRLFYPKFVDANDPIKCAYFAAGNIKSLNQSAQNITSKYLAVNLIN